MTRNERQRMGEWHAARAGDKTIPEHLRRFHARAAREIGYELNVPRKLAAAIRKQWSWTAYCTFWRAHTAEAARILRRARAPARLT